MKRRLALLVALAAGAALCQAQVRISSLSPGSAVAGGPAFTLTVTGAGFTTGAVVYWNTTALPTTYVSGLQLRASVSSSLITQPGTAGIFVMLPTGLRSNTISFNIFTPTPAISGLSPSSAAAGGSAFPLTVSGAGFVSGSQVVWGTTRLSTTFLSNTSIRADVPSTLIASPGTVEVYVANPNETSSNRVVFTIREPAPVLSSIQPSQVTAGGPQFTLTVLGNNFSTSGAAVLWNQTALTAVSSGRTSLQATVPSRFIALPGTASIAVQNADGTVSNSLPLQILPPVQLSALSPASAAAGGQQFTLTVSGSGFVNGTAVVWNQSALTTAFVSAATLQAVVPAGLIAQPGTASVSVQSPSGAVSNSLPFEITAVPLQMSGLSPASAAAGGPQFTLTVSGNGFVSGTAVLWNQTALTTVFAGATTLQAVVPAGLIAQPGTASVSAQSPSGAVSNSLPFQVTATPLQISGLNPATAAAGGPQFTLTVSGSGFVAGVAVLWNQTALTTVFVSATALQAAVPASLIAQPGTASVSVQGPSGAVSNTLPFQVTAAALQISGLSPASAVAGGPQFTLTVSGTGFVSGASVLFGQSTLPAAFLSDTSLQAAVPASLIAQPGIATVAVRNPTGATSNSIQFVIEAPLRITGLSPASVRAGGPQFTLSVTGSGFTPASLSGGSVVRWNGGALQTTYVSGTELLAVVPPNLIAQPTAASITVENTGRAVSNAVAFPVTSVVAVTGVEPGSRIAGGPPFALAVSGAGFVSGSTIRFNGVTVPTTFAGPALLQASIPSGLIAAPGTAGIDVLNPDGAVSNSLPFTILPGPVIRRLSPPSVPAGGPAFTLAVVGSGFDPEFVVTWNGAPLATEHVNDGQLNAAVPAGLIAEPGTVTIAVRGSQEVVSLGVSFVVTAAFRITSLSPPSAAAGGPAFTLTVDGSGFYDTSRVLWGGIQLPTTFVSSTRLSAAVAAARIAQPGTVNVSVEIPNIGTSNALSFTVQPALSITSLEPSSAAAGGAAFTLTVTGTGFVQGSAVEWNGSALPTVFASAARLTASVEAQFIRQPGAASVTVRNPGGAVSNAASFAVVAPLGISGLSPDSAAAGGPQFVLTVDGSGFAAGSVVRWNFTPLATNLVSPARLTATVPANLIAQPGPATITVANPDGAVSAGAVFTVTAALRIASLDPAAALAGGASLTLAVSGSGFAAGSVVQWGGVPLPTRFVSSARLTASVSAALIAEPGSASIRVVNPDGSISNAVELPVRLPAVPAVSVSGPPSNADPNDAIQVRANLAGPFPVPIVGRFTLSFEANAVGAFSDDPRNVQFANGSRIFEFTIPANQTQAPAVGLKAGTVAGTIVLTAVLLRAGESAIPTPVPTTTRIVIGRLAPRVDRACLARTAAGFDAVVIGYSTPRQITGASFQFIPNAGANLQTTELAPAGIGAAFTAWYQSAASQTNGLGSQFRLVQPFTVAGAADAVRDVRVVLSNATGSSPPVTAAFESGCPNQ